MIKSNLILVGFILFVLGFLSIILSLVGLKLDLIGFLFKIGPGFAFLTHIIMVCIGLAFMYVGKTSQNHMQAEETEPTEVSH